jgi:hypothetical protein
MANVKFSDLPVKTAAQSTAGQIFFPIVEMDGTPANFRISVMELDTLIGAGNAAPTPGPGSDISINPSTGAWTINSSAVTYAKIQNISQTLRILGRQTAGAGPAEEISVTATGLSLINQSSVSAMRTLLGLGSSAVRDETYFALASHTHPANQITGILAPSQLGTGTPTATKFLSGEGQWATPGFADADYGDIVVSSNGSVWSFSPDVVTGFARTLLSDFSAADARATLGITELASSTFGQSMITSADAAAGTALLNTFTSTLKGLTPASGGGTANFLRADGTWAAPTATLAANSVTTTIIANTAVTNAKLADMAPYALKGNSSAVSAAPSDLNGTQATSLLDTFTTTLKGLVPPPGSGVTAKFLKSDGTWDSPQAAIVAIGDYGDITVSNTGTTWTIDAKAVTYAKIQDVSATDKILGRSSAGAGVIQEITCTSFARSILDDATAADVRTTLGLPGLFAPLNVNGRIDANYLATGTASSTTYLRGDGTWSTVTGAAANPAGTTTQIQFNDAGSFGATANLTYATANSQLQIGRNSGTGAVGGAVRVEGGTGTVSTPCPASIELVQTWNYGLTNATPLIQVTVSTTGGGAGATSKLAQYSVGGTTTASLQRDGLHYGQAGFVSDKQYASGYGFSLDSGLYWDGASSIGQRDTTIAQKFSVYNKAGATANDGPGSNYERGVLDWTPATSGGVTTSNVFRIGTEKAGSGTARSLWLITDSIKRVEITAAGNIQFNSAYTFPTTDGTSGQYLQTNGAGTLSWATASSGSATPAGSSTQVQYNSSGAFAGSSNMTFDGTVLKTGGYAINSNALISSSSTSYSLTSSDNGKTIVFSGSASISVSIPTGLGAGFCVTVIQTGTGAVTFSGQSGVTLNSFGNAYSTAGQHASASLLATASNIFNLSGALA